LGSRAREERVQSSNEVFPQAAFFVLAMYSQKEKKYFFFLLRNEFFLEIFSSQNSTEILRKFVRFSIHGSRRVTKNKE
jgi:hypothetical protein